MFVQQQPYQMLQKMKNQLLEQEALLPIYQLPYVNFKDEEACNAGFFMF